MLSLDQIDEIFDQNPMPQTGDEIELTEADEKALDASWAELAEEKGLKRPTESPKRPF